jgi:hypothetical protein
LKYKTVQFLSPDPSPFEVEIAIAKFKKWKTPGIEQILAEGETLQSEVHKLITYVWNKEELPETWKESIIIPIYNKGNRI